MARQVLNAVTTLNTGTHLDPMTLDLYGLREIVTTPAYGIFPAYAASSPAITFSSSWDATFSKRVTAPAGFEALTSVSVPVNGSSVALQVGFTGQAITSTVDAFVLWASSTQPLNRSASNGSLVLAARNSVGAGMWFATANTFRGGWNYDGDFFLRPNAAAPTLSVNGDMSFQLVSNTSLKILVRGSDGVTRSTTLTLA